MNREAEEVMFSRLLQSNSSLVITLFGHITLSATVGFDSLVLAYFMIMS